MSHRTVQQRRIRELVAEPLTETGEIVGRSSEVSLP